MLGSLPFAPKPRLQRKYDHWVCSTEDGGHTYQGVANTPKEAYEVWSGMDRRPRVPAAPKAGLLLRFGRWLARPST